MFALLLISVVSAQETVDYREFRVIAPLNGPWDSYFNVTLDITQIGRHIDISWQSTVATWYDPESNCEKFVSGKLCQNVKPFHNAINNTVSGSAPALVARVEFPKSVIPKEPLTFPIKVIGCSTPPDQYIRGCITIGPSFIQIHAFECNTVYASLPWLYYYGHECGIAASTISYTT